MSFNASATGTIFEAGFFLADDENCLRETADISASHLQKVTRNGRVIVPAGAVIPANGSTAVGILYEDIDVTDGAAPGSIVTEGVIYGDLLPAALDSDAASALTGIRVISASPKAVRPTLGRKFKALSVTSEASASASGKTKLTVTGYTLGPGESYVYKTHATAAPEAKLGTDLSAGWTSWNGTDEISSTTGHKITVAVKDANVKCVAAGSADVTVKAAG